MKQQYLDKLLPLTENGESTVKRIQPPKQTPRHVYEDEPEPVIEDEFDDDEGVVVEVEVEVESED
jgi:hypothetical protein